MSSELSQSTIRVRNDARGRVRKEAAIGRTWCNTLFKRGPDLPKRGHSLWTALALPGHGRESLVYMTSSALSALAAASRLGWYVVPLIQIDHSTPTSLRASAVTATKRLRR